VIDNTMVTGPMLRSWVWHGKARWA